MNVLLLITLAQTISIHDHRPLVEAVHQLGARHHLRISVEDPPYIYKVDVEDVTAKVARTPPKYPVLVPAKRHFEFAFDSAASPSQIVTALLNAANQQLPFTWRLESERDHFTFIPTHSRDQLGNRIAITPLLDRRVTIPAGTRAMHESASMLSKQLSDQTGMHVSCCQSHVGGVPWGLPVVPFEANNETARSVIKRLVAADPTAQNPTYTWTVLCDPVSPSAFCFINLEFQVDVRRALAQ